MFRHQPADLRRFLRALDDAADEPARLIVIGGAAAVLRGGTVPTSDIDTFNQVPESVERAAEVARARTKLLIPLAFAAIADAPSNFEDRLERLPVLRLKNLEILVPERHDLALMKTIRGYEHDLQAIEELHQRRRMNLETLVRRFETEMTHVIADPRNLRLNVTLLVERLFGRETARQVRERLEQ
jgi:hypothetical protein